MIITHQKQQKNSLNKAIQKISNKIKTNDYNFFKMKETEPYSRAINSREKGGIINKL